jgi:Zn-dependent protease with chaperone function
MALSGLLWVICARAAGRWIGLPVGTLMDAVARVTANAAIFWGPLAVAALLAMALGAGGAAAPLLMGILILLYLHQRGTTLPLARRLGLVWAPGPRLRAAVESATCSAGLPPPEIHVLPSMRAQAWCLPAGRRLIFSSRLLSLLDDAELLAVVTHEVAHLRHPMSLQLLGLLHPVIALGLAAALGLFMAKGEPWVVLPAVGACVAAAMLHGGLLSLLETTAEEEADQRAAQVNALAHAGALERVYESDLLPAVSADPTHPDLYARLVAAGHRPGWSRPPAPPRWPVPVALLAFCMWSVASLSHHTMAWALPLHPDVVDEAGQVDPWALLDHLRDTGR